MGKRHALAFLKKVKLPAGFINEIMEKIDSGEVWYDSFVEWMRQKGLSPRFVAYIRRELKR